MFEDETDKDKNSNSNDGSAHDAKSFEDVRDMADCLTKASGPDDTIEVLKAIAVSDMNPLETDNIISLVSKKTGTGKNPLRRTLEGIIQELGLIPNDLALEVARTLRAEHFNEGRYLLCGPDGSYWVYEETHWKRTTTANLRKLLLKEANKVRHLYEGASISGLVNAAKRCLDDLMGTDEDVMGFADEPRPVINCLNGELWIEEGGSVSIKPHTPESRLTYCLPINYDEEASCPTYDKALLTIFSEAEDPDDLVRHWNEFVGYAIQPVRDIACFFMMIGHGSNGKSKLLQTIQKLVGKDAVINDQIASFQRDRFNIASLAGKVLFIDDDLPEHVVLADGLLKKISEAKEMTARHAYGREKFNFRCLALPVMAGNHYPQTRDVSGGLVRRAKVIPFNKVFDADEADPTLFPRIWKDELPGVLNRALEGLQRLRQRGEFLDPEDCDDALREFIGHSNPLIQFLNDVCELEDDARIFIRDLRTAMTSWARSNGINGVPSSTKLVRQLEGLGFYVGRADGKRRVHGVRVPNHLLF